MDILLFWIVSPTTLDKKLDMADRISLSDVSMSKFIMAGLFVITV
jgi:hypothetical protein